MSEHTWAALYAKSQARAEAAEAEVARLREALEPLLDEFGARLSDGKPLGYTAGSMQRALRMIHTASAALAHREEAT